MTRHQHSNPRSVARLRPSAARFAAAAAVHDPGLLLQLQAAQRGPVASSAPLLRRDGSDGHRRSSGVAIAALCRA
jgi:hypothetical protein